MSYADGLHEFSMGLTARKVCIGWQLSLPCLIAQLCSFVQFLLTEWLFQMVLKKEKAIKSVELQNGPVAICFQPWAIAERHAGVCIPQWGVHIPFFKQRP